MCRHTQQYLNNSKCLQENVIPQLQLMLLALPSSQHRYDDDNFGVVSIVCLAPITVQLTASTLLFSSLDLLNHK
jgi:hypothetical protein